MAFLIAAAVSACGNFSTQTRLDEPSGRGTEQYVETAFDNRLVDGLEEYWARCIADLVIAAWTPGALELHGRCADRDVSDSMSAEGQNVYGAVGLAAAASPIAIELPSPLFEFDMNFSFDDWPIQNCEVEATTTVFFDSIRLRTVEARWVEKDDEPALRVILTTAHPNTIHVAHRTTSAEADCPSGTSERKVQRKLDKSGINGAGFIFVDELKITIYLAFRRNPDRDRIEVVTDVNTSLEGIDVGINWNKLPGRAEESFDASIASLGSQVAAPIATHLSSVGALLEPYINSAFPDGHVVCDLEIRRSPGSGTHWPNGDLFVIRTQHPTRYGTPCIQTVRPTDGEMLEGQATDATGGRPIEDVELRQF